MKKELGFIGVALVVCTLIFQAIYFKEPSFGIIKTILSLFWMFVVPGYALTLYWLDSLDFIERLVAGIVVAFGLFAVLSYYTGILGFHIKYHGYIFPLLFIIVGSYFGLYYKKLTASFD